MQRLLILFVFAATSCAPAYLSNVRNAPTFGEAKEFAGGVSYGTSGAEMQLAYAVTDHIAVMANGNSLKEDVTLDRNYQYKRRHLFGEAGVGYFAKTGRVRAEVFAGYGAAKFDSYESNLWFNGDDSITNGSYHRTFFQPSISFDGGYFHFILTPRISIVDFRSYVAQNIRTGETMSRSFKGVQGFFEPAITARFRIWKGIFGFTQVGANIPMNGPYGYDQNAMQLVFGLQLRTSPKHDD